MSDKPEAKKTAAEVPEMDGEAEEIQKDLPAILEELAEAQTKAAEHWERLLRVQAELENLKRRTEREVSNAHKFALEKFIKDLLPIVDSLEMALQAKVPDDAKAAFAGVELTHKMFLDMLKKQGIKQLNPMGEIFNPQQEEAVTTQVNADVEPNTVVAVMQKGYMLYDRVIRPALVSVSTK